MGGLDEAAARAEAAEIGRRVEKRTVQTMRISDILEQNSVDKVDFLSIDVEGHEAAILGNFDFARYPVTLIAVEIQGEFEQAAASAPHKILSAAGYNIYARNGPTMFYVRRRGPASN